MSIIKDITGQRFGRLVVIKYIGSNKEGKALWECKCDCGNIIKILGKSLRKGITKSCGCLRNEKSSQRMTKHSMSNTKFYKVWKSLKIRTNSKEINNKCYKNINVCDEWSDYNIFYNDMYKSYLEHIKLYGEKETTIDRIDSTKDYLKDNCRWATYLEQGNNRSQLRWFKAISPKNIIYYSKHQALFSRKYDLNPQNINNCLNKKQSNHKNWKFEYINIDDVPKEEIEKYDEDIKKYLEYELQNRKDNNNV